MAFKRQKTIGKFIKYKSPSKSFKKYTKTLRSAHTKERVVRNWAKQTAPLVEKKIRDMVKKGNSPVKGFGRFKAYSKSYKEAMEATKALTKHNKKQRPVNLYLSGKMMDSFHWIQRKTGFRLQFSSSQDKKARWNSEEGVGPKKTRRPILPKRGTSEIFKSTILNLMSKGLRQAMRAANKKARK